MELQARRPRRPQTFDFLGFTHYVHRSRRGYFVVGPVFVNEVARFFHATFLCADSRVFVSFDGFSQTAGAGSQFRVLPDQRAGRAALASS